MIISLNDAQIETTIQGHGTPLILLAGLGRHTDSLKPITNLLTKQGIKTIAINLRGIGQSTGSMENISLHTLASDVAEVIKELNIEPAHILGHAFGNRVARCLATDYPSLVKSITLLAAGGKVPPKPNTREAMLKSRDPNTPEKEVKEIATGYLFSPSTKPEVTKELIMGKPEVASALLKAGNAVSVDYWWDAGDAPLLVVQGLDDVVAPPGNGRLLKESFGDRVELVELPGVGHLLQYEKPEEIVQHISEYLSNFPE